VSQRDSELKNNYRFKFEPENRFCLVGYGATVVMLTLVYLYQLEAILIEDVVIYASMTLGFHTTVQVLGSAGVLASKRRNFWVSQLAMANWAISFIYGCFLVSELRPILLIGSFLTLNFYVGRGYFQQSLTLSCLIALFYMTPAFARQITSGDYPWWGRDSIYLLTFMVSSFHASTIARYNGKLRKEVYEAKLAADKANAELKRSSESALKKAFDKVEQANRIKGELLANMSHEFRTPLNAIINVPNILKTNIVEVPCWFCESCGASFNDSELAENTTEALPEDCPDCSVSMEIAYRGESLTPFRPFELLNRSQGAGDHLLYCFDNIMNLTMLESGDIKLFCLPVRIEEVVAEVVMNFKMRPVYTERSIRVEMNLESSWAQCDSDRVREILSHLVDNALRFSAQDSEVVLRLEMGESSTIRLVVLDHGVGIDRGAYDLIFESFQQADSSHTRNFDGLGLGLTLASGLVELHGSKLQFESEVSKGSQFFFELPLSLNE